MRTSYFKPRKPFSFSPHPYDLGTFMGLWHSHDDNHFLLKIYQMYEKEFADYYAYHLKYTLENNLTSEEDFFGHVWHIVQNRIKHYEMQDPFSRNHAIHRASIEKLRRFQNYLKPIDQWNARPARIVIAEKEEIIQKQKTEIQKLLAKLSELNEHEVSQKIMIDSGHLPTLIDLIQQMRELAVSPTRKLLKSDYKIVFAKMISKYFSHGGKDIPIETVRNYFVDKKDNIPIKGTAIQLENQLFKIVPVNSAKK
jgi:hypothetical protein